MDAFSRSADDCYNTIAAPSRGLYREKGSRFLAFAYPVGSEEEARAAVASLKKEYFDARHHCFAWRIGYDGALWRVNDDGEPSSSAGRPILGQIMSNSLSDILIVVVRYFGGIKLGVPGLIRAYRSAAADAIASATIERKTAALPCTIKFSYPDMNAVMKTAKDLDLQIISHQFEGNCLLKARVRLSAAASLQGAFARIAEVTLDN